MYRLISLFLLTFHLFASLNAKDLKVELCLQSIPHEERENLTKFFRRLFCHGDFAYTLLGQKPMGSIDYNLHLLAFPQFYKNPEKHLFLMALDKKGWEIWEQYKDLFPMKRYSFIKIEQETSFGILLINKERAYAVIKKYLPLFQELVGRKLHPRKILKLLCKGQWACYPAKASQWLSYYKTLGLLYGYGEENVGAFVKREQLSQNLRTFPLEMASLPLQVTECVKMDLYPAQGSKKYPFQNDNIGLLASELHLLLDKFRLIQGTNNPLFPLHRSSFVGNEQGEQTQSILKGYDSVNQSILNIYESDAFLETILEILTS